MYVTERATQARREIAHNAKQKEIFGKNKNLRLPYPQL